MIGEMEVIPLAAESMGVRSMCTSINTPDLKIVLDPSAALSMRYQLEPHPQEYRSLQQSLEDIFVAVRKADIISISHYHFDHVRPGFTDFRYTLSSKEELQRMFEGKTILAKDNRENINPSQRRRGFYFQKDLQRIADEIKLVDGVKLQYGNTVLSFSNPLPHGPEDTHLGFVLSTSIEYDGCCVLFAPDVQGPVVKTTLEYIQSVQYDMLIVGGPPIYLRQFTELDRQNALNSLLDLTSSSPILLVDHHLIRSPEWSSWLEPVRKAAEQADCKLVSAADIVAGNYCYLENNRPATYANEPPNEEFMNWTKATDEYKRANKPPTL
ncbi:MAG: MBL fold metallo-hydrolase [Candidatus Thorarchaeota archaeon]|jgi:predicted metallo-beta-lactamase superfamily hydrolase